VSLFRVEGLGFGFAGGAKLVDGLDWELVPGEIFAILGPSGVGKSVFLRLLVRLLSPTEGRVLFAGKDLSSLSRREEREFYRKVGFAFQRNGLFDSLSCGDNLRFPLNELLGLGLEEREARVSRALEDVGLSGQAELAISEMSGGMQKRLGMARALALAPEAILYDEPTAGLDPLTSVKIHELILETRKKYGMSAVLSTTDPVQAFRLADRVGYLHEGRLIEVGSPDKVKASAHPVVRQFLEGRAEGPLTEAIP
jgi:phospholipid/cholesterol/gamma-HCH transport system ATP-binding protein